MRLQKAIHHIEHVKITRLVFFFCFLSFTAGACTQPATYRHHEGLVFGTVYRMTYQATDDLQEEVEAALQQVDNALSMFNQQSVISAVNRGDSVVPHTTEGDMLLTVYNLAEQVSSETSGAFDITVAPLVNAWGFGFRQGIRPDSATVDSLLQFTGHHLVSYWTERDNHGLSKADPRVMLDCSAIAKGYGVDIVGQLLADHGVTNYMVEIGGEVLTHGNNPQGRQWHIGVTKPIDNSLATSGELQTILAVNDVAMATSGNYRNFYYEGGRKLAHTIDPHTGQPVQHELLSATVIAPSCAQADAYATAFMVMGLKQAKDFLQHHPELMAYFIYAGEHDEFEVWYSPALQPLINDR